MSRTAVVILNWNGCEHLVTFLPSVVSTTPANVRIVVADNGSTDGSVDTVRMMFPQIEILELGGNHGYAGGYNRAIAQIDADFYILLNSDVQTAPGWCEPLIEALEADERLGAVQPKILSWRDPASFEYAGACGGFIDILGYPFCRGRILSTVERDKGQYDSFRTCFWASGACFACRRELFGKVGGLDEDFFAHMEEIDLCWRAQLYGYSIAVQPRSVVYHLGGGTLAVGSPRKTYLNYRNNLWMLYKNLPGRRLGIILPIRMLVDGLAAGIYLLQGHGNLFRQVFRAHMDFYRNLNPLKIKRREVQSQAVSRPGGIYRGSVILRWLFGRKRFGGML